MSSLGQPHPEMSGLLAYVKQKFGVTPRIDVQCAEVWSYSTLAKTLNFVGCEVLMIDAEGHDTRILKAALDHCEQNPQAWPWLIQFETMGHCDQLENHPGEWDTIRLLQKAGYLLVGYSYYDSYLVFEATSSEPGL